MKKNPKGGEVQGRVGAGFVVRSDRYIHIIII